MGEPSEDALLIEAGGGRRGSLLPTMAAVAALTVVAIAGGGGVGYLIGERPAEAAPASTAPTAEAAGPAAADAEALAGTTAAPGGDTLLALEPIVTNIASPPSSQVRVEASLLVQGAEIAAPDLLAAQVHADTLVFLRTIDLAQIEGARGLLHLREDLRERAQMRSPAVSDYIIRSLVAQ